MANTELIRSLQQSSSDDLVQVLLGEKTDAWVSNRVYLHTQLADVYGLLNEETRAKVERSVKQALEAWNESNHAPESLHNLILLVAKIQIELAVPLLLQLTHLDQHAFDDSDKIKGITIAALRGFISNQSTNSAIILERFHEMLADPATDTRHLAQLFLGTLRDQRSDHQEEFTSLIQLSMTDVSGLTQDQLDLKMRRLWIEMVRILEKDAAIQLVGQLPNELQTFIARYQS